MANKTDGKRGGHRQCSFDNYSCLHPCPSGLRLAMRPAGDKPFCLTNVVGDHPECEESHIPDSVYKMIESGQLVTKQFGDHTIAYRKTEVQPTTGNQYKKPAQMHRHRVGKRTNKLAMFASPARSSRSDQSEEELRNSVKRLFGVKSDDSREEGLRRREVPTKAATAVPIKKLHEYNKVKDLTQALLGKIADMEGKSMAEVHEEFKVTEKMRD